LMCSNLTLESLKNKLRLMKTHKIYEKASKMTYGKTGGKKKKSKIKNFFRLFFKMILKQLNFY